MCPRQKGEGLCNWAPHAQIRIDDVYKKAVSSLRYAPRVRHPNASYTTPVFVVPVGASVRPATSSAAARSARRRLSSSMETPRSSRR